MSLLKSSSHKACFIVFRQLLFVLSDECDLEQTWRDHCENTAVLSEYAEAMHKLATQHWTNNPGNTLQEFSSDGFCRN